MEEKNKQVRKLVMVELKVPMDDIPDVTFFGNKKAICDYFGERLGISYIYLKNINLENGAYENAICRISAGELWSSNSPAVVERLKKDNRTPTPSYGGYQSRKNQEQEPK